MSKKSLRKVRDPKTVDMKWLRGSGKNWVSVKEAARLEGVSVGRMYHFIWQERREAVKFAGIILVVPAPRKVKKKNTGRPRSFTRPNKKVVGL
jgi:hypothetical protein